MTRYGMSRPLQDEPTREKRRSYADAFALVIAASVFTAVVAGTLTSCGEADLLIPGSGPIFPSINPSDGTPEATDTPDI